jgi:cell pole-organizing protein PopZ
MPPKKRGRKAKAKSETVEEESPVVETMVEETVVEKAPDLADVEKEVTDENMDQTEENTETPEENTEENTEEKTAEINTEEMAETSDEPKKEETEAPEAPESTETTETTETPKPTETTEKTETDPENPYNTDKWNNKHADSLYLQVRGFPYETTVQQMAAYFELADEEFTGAEIAVGIRGKPCGEFFFQAKDEDVAVKVCGKHKEHYVDTGRYIDVFRCSQEYYHRRLSINMHYSEAFDGTVKFKFIPFNSSPEGVVKSLLENITYLEETLVCPTSASGKTTGIAFVQFGNFSEARKVLEKNGADGIKIVESCNNELRGALLCQAKLAYMKKWADAKVGGGTYFSQKKVAGQKRETEGVKQEVLESENVESENMDSSETDAKKPKTDITPEITPESFMADINRNAPNNVVPAPVVAVTPPKPKTVNNSPYPHIITLSSVAIGTKATEIQKFFKPHRAIAVNIRAGGIVDVAFKTHEVAEKAMEKMGSALKDFVPDFELNSVA